jgi:hypothetical protein
MSQSISDDSDGDPSSSLSSFKGGGDGNFVLPMSDRKVWRRNHVTTRQC